MKVKSVLIAVVLTALATGSALGVRYYINQVPEEEVKVESDPYLELVGPPPKAVADELIYDFGAMERGTEGEHIFTFRNDGEGVLRVRKGKATCTCTEFVINDDEDLERLELKPGDSAKVKVAWKVKGKNPSFNVDAPLHTNDPVNKYIPFTVTGKVVYTLFVHPARTWTAPDMMEGKPVHARGIVGSRLLDDFEIVSVDTDSEFLEIKTTKLDFETAAYKPENAKCGYDFDIRISPDIPVGRFQETVNVKIKTPEGKEIEDHFNIVTTRTGAFKVVGANFDQHTMTADLRSFSMTDGVNKTLNMFVTVPEGEEPYTFEVENSDNENVKLNIVHDSEFQGEQLNRYKVEFSIAPGVLTTPENQGRAIFIVKSNHPDIKSLQFRVKYQSF